MTVTQISEVGKAFESDAFSGTNVIMVQIVGNNHADRFAFVAAVEQTDLNGPFTITHVMNVAPTIKRPKLSRTDMDVDAGWLGLTPIVLIKVLSGVSQELHTFVIKQYLHLNGCLIHSNRIEDVISALRLVDYVFVGYLRVPNLACLTSGINPSQIEFE